MGNDGPSPAAKAGQNIGATTTMFVKEMYRSSETDFNIAQHGKEASPDWHRGRVQMRAADGTWIDNIKYYDRLLPGVNKSDKTTWNGNVIEDSHWTLHLKYVYGEDVINAALGGNRFINTRTELKRKTEAAENKGGAYVPNVAFFRDHNLDFGKFKQHMQQCINAPDEVFPELLRKKGWDDVLWLYDTKFSDLIEQLSQREIEALEKEYFTVPPRCAPPREDRPAPAAAVRPRKMRKVQQQQAAPAAERIPFSEAAEYDCVTKGFVPKHDEDPQVHESDDEEDSDDDEEVTQVRRESADPLPFGAGECQVDPVAAALPAPPAAAALHADLPTTPAAVAAPAAPKWYTLAKSDEYGGVADNQTPALQLECWGPFWNKW